LDDGVSVLACSACGAYTSWGLTGRTKLLARPCLGGARPGLATQRWRIAQGPHPQGADGPRRERRIVSRRPAALAVLAAAFSAKDVERGHPAAAGSRPAASTGVSLQHALEWVGISEEEVPRLFAGATRHGRHSHA